MSLRSYKINDGKLAKINDTLYSLFGKELHVYIFMMLQNSINDIKFLQIIYIRNQFKIATYM